MKKAIIKVLCLIIFSVLTISTVVSNEPAPMLLKGYVSEVPEGFYGLWRVSSSRVETNSPGIFKQKGVDLWNLSLTNNVINLSNPFSGATAEVSIQSVEGNTIIFSKNGKYNNKNLTDTVNITLSKDFFEGENILKLETISEIDGRIMKTETARYKLKGEKIAGQSVIKD